VVRRPLTTKPTTVSNVSAASTRTREVTKTTVHVESKTRQVVAGGKVHTKKISKTKVEAVNIEETDVDEDEVRSHKRPRLSSEHDKTPVIPIIPEAKEITSTTVTVEEVQAVIASVRGVIPEKEEHDDLDKEDADDPLMVAEYVVEIFDYLRALEVGSFTQALTAVY
jgi:G2/mitotic-specific cyclin 1/2